MSISLKPVEEQTIVITGATSGIGLATAKKAVGKGANVVLVARDPDELEDAEAQCQQEGDGDTLTVAADVADRAGLVYVRQQAEELFGTIDTWINNAGVSMYGYLWDTPEEDARQLFETNYWGVVHGSLVALEHWREHEGHFALLNVGSVVSDRALPLQGHYSASKHAVKGFTDAFRMEVEEQDLSISVTLIKPSSINTPYPEHAANHMDKEAKLPEPTYDPEVVARAMLRAAAHPQRDVTVGAKDGSMAALGKAAPRTTDKVMEATMFDQQRGERMPRGESALHEPASDRPHTQGSSQGYVFQSSAWTQAEQRPLAALGAAFLAGAAVVWGLKR